MLAVRLSALLRIYRLPTAVTSTEVAERCEKLADEVSSSGSFDISHSLLSEAAQWYGEKQSDRRSRCIHRDAELYEVEARNHGGGPPNALRAASNLEGALKQYLSLPRKYRKAHGLDERISEVRRRLKDKRQASIDAMVPIQTEPIDIAPAVERARSCVAGRPILDALASFVGSIPLADEAKAREDAISQRQGSISALFSHVTLSKDGRKVASTEGGTDPENQDVAVWQDMMRAHQMKIALISTSFIQPALEVISLEHRLSRSLFLEICRMSPSIPSDVERLWAAGLAHGAGGDFASAVFLLAPMLERWVRGQMKLADVNTLAVDPDGNETEKGLGTLLEMTESEEIFGSSLRYEIRALCCDPSGPNLRNEVTHGLVTDAYAWSANTRYLWWLCLRLAFLPLYNRMSVRAEEADNDNQAV